MFACSDFSRKRALRSSRRSRRLRVSRPALRQEDADPSLLAMAGRLSITAGDGKQALAYFARALSSAPSAQRVDVQLEVASGYIVAGELGPAP